MCAEQILIFLSYKMIVMHALSKIIKRQLFSVFAFLSSVILYMTWLSLDLFTIVNSVQFQDCPWLNSAGDGSKSYDRMTTDKQTNE